MEIGDRDRILHGEARPLVGGLSIHKTLLHAATEQGHGRAAGEVAVLAVVIRLEEEILRGAGLIGGLRAGPPLGDHVAAELAGDDDECPVEEPAGLEIADQRGDGAIDLLVHPVDRLVTALVGVPVDEGDVFGCHLDIPGAVLDEPAGEEAAAAEAAGVVLLDHLLRLERDVERRSLLGRKKAMGVFQAPQHRLLVVVARELAARCRGDELLEVLVAIGKPARFHPLRRPDGERRLLGEGEIHRAKLAPEEAGRGEGLDLLVLADPFQTLADVDKRRHGGIARPEDARHPGADVRAGDRLRRHVAGVPVILMARVEDAPQVGLNVRADERAAIEDARDPFEPRADLHAVDRGGDRRKGADAVGDREPLFKRLVLLRVEIVGGRHPAGHPEDDDGVGRRARVLDRCIGQEPRLRQRERGRRRGRQALEEVAARLMGAAGLHRKDLRTGGTKTYRMS